MQKVCFKCGVEKSVEEFYRHYAMGDGHLGKCKECTKRDVQARYAEKRDTVIKEYERKRFQTPERKAKVKEYQRKRRAANPVKYAANTLVGNAIRDGKLVRQPCEVCGKAKVEAHHTDYYKPLDVMWLCRKHHLEAHGKESYSDTTI